MKTVGFACFFHLAAEIGCFPFGIEGDFWQACSVGRFFSSGLAEWEMSVFGRNFIMLNSSSKCNGIHINNLFK
ncbi:hypothetical protein, partial [Alistipes putredinis]|uniref:hypothetical protein n=1 Tax=Alistipes putredinis TaxID=28117 RepID=UPI002671F225